MEYDFRVLSHSETRRAWHNGEIPIGQSQLHTRRRSSAAWFMWFATVACVGALKLLAVVRSASPPFLAILRFLSAFCERSRGVKVSNPQRKVTF